MRETTVSVGLHLLVIQPAPHPSRACLPQPEALRLRMVDVCACGCRQIFKEIGGEDWSNMGALRHCMGDIHEDKPSDILDAEMAGQRGDSEVDTQSLPDIPQLHADSAAGLPRRPRGSNHGGVTIVSIVLHTAPSAWRLSSRRKTSLPRSCGSECLLPAAREIFISETVLFSVVLETQDVIVKFIFILRLEKLMECHTEAQSRVSMWQTPPRRAGG